MEATANFILQRRRLCQPAGTQSCRWEASRSCTGSMKQSRRLGNPVTYMQTDVIHADDKDHAGIPPFL